MNELLLQIPVIGMEVEQFLLLLITALAGGAFGAAIGALPAFIFTGFVVFLGEGLAILNRGIASSAASDVGYVSVTGVIGFGAITGPHIAFAGGVAASAYAAKSTRDEARRGRLPLRERHHVRVRDEARHPRRRGDIRRDRHAVHPAR